MRVMGQKSWKTGEPLVAIELPTPNTGIDVFRKDPVFNDAIWALVHVDLDWKRSAVA